MPTDAVSRRRMYSGSTSIPARNVSTIDANDGDEVEPAPRLRSKTFPTTTPSVSSTSATVTPSSTETMLASEHDSRENRRELHWIHDDLLHRRRLTIR